jgi:hypothetical protein
LLDLGDTVRIVNEDDLRTSNQHCAE